MAANLGNSDELLKELDLKNYVTFVKKCFKNGIKKEQEDICAQDLRNLAKCLPRVSGVWYDLHKNSWEARWAEGTKSARKYYSVQKFGFHEARKLAIKTIKTKEINYIYNSINEDFSKPLKWNLNNEFLEMNHDPIINLKRKYRSPSGKVREKRIKKDPTNGNGVSRKNKGEKKSAAQTRGLRRGHAHYTSAASCNASPKNGPHKIEKQQGSWRDRRDGKKALNQSEASYILDGTISKLRSDQGTGDIASQHVVEGSLSSTCLKQKDTSTNTEMALSTEGNTKNLVHIDECNATCLSEEDPLGKDNLCNINEKGKSPSSVHSLNGYINGVDDYHTPPRCTSNDSDKMEENNSSKQDGDKTTPKVGNAFQKHTLGKKIPNCNKDIKGKEKTSMVKFPGSKILSYMRQHKKTKNKNTLYVKQSGVLKMNLKQPPRGVFSREYGTGWNRKNLKKKSFVSEKRACLNGGALFVKKIKSCNHAEGKKCRNCDFRRRQMRGLRDHGSLLISSVLPNGGETFNGGESSNGGETFNGEESPNGGEIFNGEESPNGGEIFNGEESPNGGETFNGGESPKVDLTDQLGTGEASPTGGETDAQNGDGGGDQTGKHLVPQKKDRRKEEAQGEEAQKEDTQKEHTQTEHTQTECTQTECTPLSTPSGEKAQKMKCCVEINLKEVIHADTLSIFKNAINLLLNDLKCKCVPHLDKQFLNILEIIDNHISYVNSMLSEHILITYVHLFDICVSNNILPSQMDQNIQKVFCNALIAFHILLFNFLRDRRS
ncbi:transcription factor with AP2 domain(s) [Plasmodium cynomolgi strain B]|uniref:Transcription factor with AP2 domain(S) n=1 Tax=Plasmodium cynomolgi (strain B) TaxID=1120755 RepID=K6UEI7_PLACD|nr:transcription factor with AP2 domain(s) [Plasmodium cynomolgi strain B]GAB68421.1 transcription factor with AP2 domain(s) [Plasmodium cynomolgi strain B]